MEDERSSEDGLGVVGGKVEVFEHSIAFLQTPFRVLLEELSIGGAQFKEDAIRFCSNNSVIIDFDLAEVADVSSFVANEKIIIAPWIVVATCAGAEFSKVTVLMDVEAVLTWG